MEFARNGIHSDAHPEKDCIQIRIQEHQQHTVYQGSIHTAPHNSETYRSKIQLSQKRQLKGAYTGEKF